MTWHLKDRELEKKLIAIDPDFVKTLTETVEENLKLTNGWFNDESVTDVELTYNGERLGIVSFYTDTLEEVPEYNPNGWNEFPAVTPPDSRVCQLTVSRSLDEPVNYYAAFYDFRAKTWRVQDSGRPIDTKVLKDGFVTFRAWRD